METAIIYNSDLYFEHKQWRRELFFWEDEIKSFKNRLSELVNRWTDKKVLAQLEHYQNQFFIQESIIDKFQEDIIAHETNIAAHFKKGEDVLDQPLVKKHIEFRNHMDTQRRIYTDLKKEFYRFLSKYM
ncbi:hypothetical protein BX611_0051 [Lutibacter oceani]|uniref:Uncharacterized protein n=1 Tax=Lutibacter oceani TaxID=1853311 RepID=A0A3D9RY79_9FLAO|nr:hypothetical protein [Lutibacter oceani]REE82781.1 hypothetical protein BX611_0051 [Lutibacter oceani]